MLKKILVGMIFVILTTYFIIPLASIEIVEAKGADITVGDLVDEDFTQNLAYGVQGPITLPGWETDCSGGDYECGYHDWFRLRDISSCDKVSIKKSYFKQTSGSIILDYKFMSSSLQNAVWELRNRDNYGIRIKLKTNGNIVYTNSSGQDTIMQTYGMNVEYGIRVIADIANRKADIYINGVLKALQIDFCNNVESLDSIYISTGNSTTGDLYLNGVKITKGYLVFDRFLAYQDGNQPCGYWTSGGSGGNVNVCLNRNAPFPDIYSLKMDDTSTENNLSLLKTFTPQTGKLVFEFKFMLPSTDDGYVFELQGGSTIGPRIETYQGNLCYVDMSGTMQTIQACIPNLWYEVKEVCDVTTCMSDIYVNGKLIVTGTSFRNFVGSLDKVCFYTPISTSGLLWLDDIKVYPFHAEPADYVPEPNAVSHAGTYIGIQSCPLWREGHAPGGWDLIVPYAPDRKSLLGWYEEGNREAADWEIKWMVEHGIDFNMFCWYLPNGRANIPLQRSEYNFAIHDGFFNAKYSNYMKFAIDWAVDDTTIYGASDFRNNIVPYLIDYYFKDPRYMVIDNKPVIGLINSGALVQVFGGADECKNEMDYLRQQCVNVGFSGAYIIDNCASLTQSGMDGEYDCGFDYAYRYSYGAEDTNLMKNQMMAQRDSGSDFGVIPTISMGWDCEPWNGTKGGWVSTEDFQNLSSWVKDTFAPSLPENSLGRKMVMLDNWNEYGEGHFMMPTEGLGFDYLDIIRHTWVCSDNLAQGKSGFMSDGTPIQGFDADKAIDGDENTYTQSNSDTPWDLTVDLGTPTLFDKVVLVTNPINYATVYTIDVSNDNTNWTTVATETAGNGTEKTYIFSAVNARYIKMNVTSAYSTNPGWGHGIHEFGVYLRGGSSHTDIVPSISQKSRMNTLFPQNDWNIAQGKSGSMSGGTPIQGFDVDKAIDGDENTYAQSNSDTPWDMIVDLGVLTSFNKVVLKTNPINYATVYTIDVSNDNTNWTTVAMETAGNGTEKTHVFSTIDARYVKVNVTDAYSTDPAWGHAIQELWIYKDNTGNLALGKTSYISDGTPIGDYGADKAVDGDCNTYAQTDSNIPWDYSLDLGTVTLIDTFSLRPGPDDYAVDYTIIVSSDNNSWTTVAVRTGGNGMENTFRFNPISARYVKMNVTSAHSSGSYGHKIYEFEVLYSGNSASFGKYAYMNASPAFNSQYWYSCNANCALDGNTGTYAQANSNVPWDLTIDYGKTFLVDRVYLNTDSIQFATNYTIDVSTDNTNWTTVAVETEGNGTPKNYCFDAINVRYLRVNVIAAYGIFAHRIREIQVFEAGNLAFGKTVLVNTTCLENRSPDNAADGNYNTYTQPDNGDLPLELTVDLGSVTLIDKVNLLADNNARIHSIEVSTDNINWTTVASAIQNPANIIFGPVSARCVKLKVTSLRYPDVGPKIYEIQVYNHYPLLYEAENLTAIMSLGDTHSIISEIGFSSGYGDRFNANEANDYIEYTVNIPIAGTYNIKYRVNKNMDRGMYQLSIDGTNQGDIKDTYSAANAYEEFELGDVSFSTAGNKLFRFTCIGKNASSSGYGLFVEYVKLTHEIPESMPMPTPQPAPIPIITQTWDYGATTEGWVSGGGMTGFGWQQGGYIGGTITDSDPAIYSEDNLGIDINNAKILKICIKNNTASSVGTIYFTTNDDIYFDSNKQLNFTMIPNDLNYTVYTLDMSYVLKWIGTLRRLRIDPEEGVSSGYFSIDYVRIQNYVLEPSPVKIWDFDSTTESWVNGNENISGFEWQQGGYVGGTIVGSDPQIYSVDDLGLDITNAKKIKICMKNSTPANFGQIYFTTYADNNWDESKSKCFVINTNDPNYTIYDIDVSDITGWTGTLNRLRVDPVGNASSGSFSINYIRIEY